MSKAISGALLAHYVLGSTTISTCWMVTRRDGVVFGFTDYDVDILFSGQTYLAATGYTRTAVVSSDALNVDNLDVEGFLDSASITDADLLAGLWDFATVEIFQVNRADLTQGRMWIRKGHLGHVSTGRNAFVAELRGMMQTLQLNIGRIYSPSCDADLGDARCGVNLATYTVTGTLTSVSDKARFWDSTRAEAAGWFDGGLITWTGGANVGLEMEVKTYLSPLITLQQPMPFAVAIGDAYSMSAGCDKLISTCRDKFNNVINHRGFPYFPGNDRMISGL